MAEYLILSEPLREELKSLLREVLDERERNGNGHSKPLTAEELAQALNISKATVYERVKKREIPYLKTGRLLRFNLQAVLDSQGKK
jgi:excisionase family DNA binding protein